MSSLKSSVLGIPVINENKIEIQFEKLIKKVYSMNLIPLNLNFGQPSQKIFFRRMSH